MKKQKNETLKHLNHLGLAYWSQSFSSQFIPNYTVTDLNHPILLMGRSQTTLTRRGKQVGWYWKCQRQADFP